MEVPSFLSLCSAPSHTVYGQEPWNFPILKEKLLGEPGSVTTHDLNYAQVFKNTEGSSIIKCIKQSSQPKKAVAEKKNRVWAALWEINSTAFHQVEILALDTHKNEPGLIWAPSGYLPDHKSWPNWPASPQRRPLLEQQMVLLVRANMDGQDSRQEDGRTQQAWTRWEPAFKRITFTMHLFKITT